MWQILKAAWSDLGPTGKMVVAVVILLAGAGLLGLAMWLGYNLDWLPGLLSGGDAGAVLCVTVPTLAAICALYLLLYDGNERRRMVQRAALA